MSQARLLLPVLYLSFISLGLPDSVLGVAWPTLRLSFGQPLFVGGLLVSMTTIISVLSSLAAPWVMKRCGTGVIITFCALLTSCAMFGYALSPVWAALLLFTLLFGIGQGAVDTAVNSYMARNYSARHMNWVHACWGIGATGGPLIMTAVLGLHFSWRGGYAAIGIIQFVLALVFLKSLPLWRSQTAKEATAPAKKEKALEGLKGSRLGMAGASGVLFYFLYPGVEYVSGFWAASYLVEALGASPALAGTGVTIYWGALTAGRIANGVIAERFANRNIIRAGIVLAALGVAGVVTAHSPAICILFLAFVGFGLSGLYPTMMHDTPRRLGPGAADRVVGFQVGAAMAGTAVIPLVVGMVASRLGLAAFGPSLCIFLALVLIMHEISLRSSLLGAKSK